MRCESCCKFVSLETQEPEVNSVDVSGTTVTVDARSVRNCADCGTEMKALDINEDYELELDKFEGWADLGEKRQEQLREAWDAGQIEVEVEDDGGETNESGGSRYKKNILITSINFTATFSWEGLDFKFSGTVNSEHAASEYEEQC